MYSPAVDIFSSKKKLPVFLTGVPPETSNVQSYIDIAERYRSRLRKPVSTPKQHVNLQWSTAAQLVDNFPNAPTERVNRIRKSEKEIQKLLSGGRPRRRVLVIFDRDTEGSPMPYWFRYHNDIVGFYLGLQKAWQLFSRFLTLACTEDVGRSE